MDDARFLVLRELDELPIEPDAVRRCFLDVVAREDGGGYEHASRELKEVFDAIGLAASDLKSGRGSQSMDVLAANDPDGFGTSLAGNPGVR